MKIFAYHLVQKGPRTLPTLIDRIHALPLQDRFFGRGNIRLEERTRRGGFLYMDFAKERGGHGPGRMARDAALEAIRLGRGQSFAEDTGVAYDLATGYAAVQYNHHGPRSRSIEEYLYACDLRFGGLPGGGDAGDGAAEHCGIKFGALLKPGAYARIRNFGIIHQIDFTVALPGVNRDDLEAGRSLSDILRAPLPEGVDTISMSIRATPGRQGALGRDRAFGIIDDLQRLGVVVKDAFVRGKAEARDPYEVIDLVEERITADPEVELSQGRRYSRDDRWGALGETLQAWLRDRTLQGAHQ